MDEDASSYRVSIWDFERGQMNLRCRSEEFSDMDIKALVLLPTVERPHALENREYHRKFTRTLHDSITIRFATVEEQAIKFWECESGILKTVKKLNVKQSLIDAVSSDMIGFIIVLGRNGAVLILNSEGKYVSTIERADVQFTSVAVSNENLFLGTFSG